MTQPVVRLKINLLDLIARSIIFVFLVEVVSGIINLIGFQGHIAINGWDELIYDVTLVITWMRSIDSIVVYLLLPISIFLVSSALFSSEIATTGLQKLFNLNIVFVAIGIYFLGDAAYLVAFIGSVIVRYQGPWVTANALIQILAQILIGIVSLTICLRTRKTISVRERADAVEVIF